MQIFISSTFYGMQNYLKAAVEGILAAGHIPISLEHLPQPANSIQSQEVINSALESSDVHIALFGENYRAFIPNEKISWMEFETERASQLGKPGFVFIIQKFKETHVKNLLAHAYMDRVAESHWVNLITNPSELRYSIQQVLFSLDAEDKTVEKVDSETASIILPSVKSKDFRTLLEHPEELQKCSPRYFEELIAELLKSDGWEVEIVTRVNAPGPDIIAISSSIVDGVPLKLIVECKKYSNANPVDINVVKKVMYWVNEEYRATMGMIATTSRFTKDAIEHANQYHEWRLNRKDQLAILHWLKRNFGAKFA